MGIAVCPKSLDGNSPEPICGAGIQVREAVYRVAFWQYLEQVIEQALISLPLSLPKITIFQSSYGSSDIL